MEIFLLGKVNLSLARGGMLIFIVCWEKNRKQLTRDYYYYYFLNEERNNYSLVWVRIIFFKIKKYTIHLGRGCKLAVSFMVEKNNKA